MCMIILYFAVLNKAAEEKKIGQIHAKLNTEQKQQDLMGNKNKNKLQIAKNIAIRTRSIYKPQKK